MSPFQELFPLSSSCLLLFFSPRPSNVLHIFFSIRKTAPLSLLVDSTPCDHASQSKLKNNRNDDLEMNKEFISAASDIAYKKIHKEKKNIKIIRFYPLPNPHPFDIDRRVFRLFHLNSRMHQRSSITPQDHIVLAVRAETLPLLLAAKMELMSTRQSLGQMEWVQTSSAGVKLAHTSSFDDPLTETCDFFVGGRQEDIRVVACNLYPICGILPTTNSEDPMEAVLALKEAESDRGDLFSLTAIGTSESGVVDFKGSQALLDNDVVGGGARALTFDVQTWGGDTASRGIWRELDLAGSKRSIWAICEYNARVVRGERHEQSKGRWFSDAIEFQVTKVLDLSDTMKERLVVNKDSLLRLDHILDILNKHVSNTSQRNNSANRGCDLDREGVPVWRRSFDVAEGQNVTKDAVVGQGLCDVLNMNSVYKEIMTDDGNSVGGLGVLNAVQED